MMWAVEDLMREHALLSRIMTIYEHLSLSFKNGTYQSIDWTISYKCAYIVRHFIENYHERSEEQFIFPILKKYNKHRKLVNELIKQHKLGRQMTDRIIDLSKSKSNASELSLLLHLFCKLYRVHASREDTVIFQDLYGLLTVLQRQALTDKMQQAETNESFDQTLKSVEALEKKLGIHDIYTLTKYIESSLI